MHVSTVAAVCQNRLQLSRVAAVQRQIPRSTCASCTITSTNTICRDVKWRRPQRLPVPVGIHCRLLGQTRLTLLDQVCHLCALRLDLLFVTFLSLRERSSLMCYEESSSCQGHFQTFIASTERFETVLHHSVVYVNLLSITGPFIYTATGHYSFSLVAFALKDACHQRIAVTRLRQKCPYHHQRIAVNGNKFS